MDTSIAVADASTLTLWYAQGSHLGAATRSDDLVAAGNRGFELCEATIL